MRNPFTVLALNWAWDCSLGGIPASTVPDLPWITANISAWVHHYRICSQRENTNVFRYEDTVADPLGTVERLSALLGEGAILRQPLLPDKLRGPWHSRWNRVAGIHPASTEIHTSGGGPDPIALFDDAGIALVLRIAGEVLEELRYEIRDSREA